MCGIVGYTQKQNKMVHVSVLEKMMDRIAHRGPDGSGLYYDAHIAIGHRRLAIIDVDGGEQPMKNEDQSIVCAFNGEIYNHKELRIQLVAKGHEFKTKCDTEVLIHGFEEWRYELPKKLRGMFSFVIWDAKNKELFCARDYFGIKPFYYYLKDGNFMFGSEIKSFLEHPDFEKELNTKQLERYLSYQYSPGNETFFKNVFKLPPAHYLIRRGEEMELVQYWYPVQNEDKETSIDGFADKISEIMEDSVKAHKISDVEVGSFLSSGVDSTYLSAVSKVDKTFTLGYEEERYDESSKIRSFPKSEDYKNYLRILGKTEFFDRVKDVQYYMDEPLADAASISLFFLNEEASKHVKVCLSGEGADELFGGYNVYKEPFMWQGYNKINPIIRKGIGAIAELLPPMRGRNFLVRHASSVKERYIGPTCLFSEKEKRKLLKNYVGADKKKITLSAHATDSVEDDINYMQMTDLNQWLVGDILLKADKMSMAHSLEVRVPFLDKEVFDVASHIPVAYRANKEETKIAFRKCAKKVVGEEPANRMKKGFPVPIRDWIKEEPYHQRIKDAFESQTAKKFFNSKMLVRMLEKHVSDKGDYWRYIWCVYVFLIWYERFFEPVREEVKINPQNEQMKTVYLHA
jgi:asparagine synthase (glutamine-hydrolysing)